MARRRILSPDFFADDNLGACSPLARLLFAGMWTIADRLGRLEDRPARIKAAILPYDNVEGEPLVAELARVGCVDRYDGYLQINDWARHQDPHKNEIPSKIPAKTPHSILGQPKANLGQPKSELIPLDPRSLILDPDLTPASRSQTHVATRRAPIDHVPFSPPLEVSGSDARDPHAPTHEVPAPTHGKPMELALWEAPSEAATVVELNRKPKETPKAKTGPTVFESVSASFCASWGRFRKADYIVTPADKSQLGRLLQSLPPDAVLRLPAIFDRYCADLDQFVSEQGHSLKYFCTSGAINKYGSTDRAQGMNQNERKGAMNVMGWAAKKMAAAARGEKI